MPLHFFKECFGKSKTCECYLSLGEVSTECDKPSTGTGSWKEMQQDLKKRLDECRKSDTKGSYGYCQQEARNAAYLSFECMNQTCTAAPSAALQLNASSPQLTNDIKSSINSSSSKT